MVFVYTVKEARRLQQQREEKSKWYKGQERRQAHKYYKESGYVSEAESIDMWRERAKRSAALSKKRKEAI